MITSTHILSNSVFTVAILGIGVFASSMVPWRFHNSTFFWGVIVSPMPNPQPEDLGIPGAYAPTNIALQVSGECKSPPWVVRKIFDCEREEVIGGWRDFHQ
jgi:hypothetical protein